MRPILRRARQARWRHPIPTRLTVSALAALTIGALLAWETAALSAGGYPAGPNDPFFNAESNPAIPQQWGPQKIGASRAWESGAATGNGITVAVLDTGVDLEHEDLACPDKFVPGHDFIEDDAEPDDENGHGTHVAGIIAACTNNGIGIAGAAPHAKIMPLRVLNESGTGTVGGLYKAIRFAAEEGAHVINMSLSTGPQGFWFGNVIHEEAVRYAASRGVVMVAAAGNSAADPCETPASLPEVICVGATDENDMKSWYSSFAAKAEGVAMVAPGGDGELIDCRAYAGQIFSLVPLDHEYDCPEDPLGYANANGTSMAAPHVAAAAALVYERLGGERSATKAQDVIDVLTKTAVDLGPTGWDPAYGYGRVDVGAAVGSLPLPPGYSLPTPGESAPASEPEPSPTAPPQPSETTAPEPEPSLTPQPEPSQSTAPAPEPSERDVTLRASREVISLGESVRLKGRVVSMEPGCVGDQRVSLMARREDGRWREIRTANTFDEGGYSFSLRPRITRRYKVRAAASIDCESATSPVDRVKVRPG